MRSDSLLQTGDTRDIIHGMISYRYEFPSNFSKLTKKVLLRANYLNETNGSNELWLSVSTHVGIVLWSE